MIKKFSQSNLKLPKIPSQATKSPEKGKKKLYRVEDSSDKNLTAQAYGIYDMSLKKIVESNSCIRRQIASLTKMMTLLCSVNLSKKFKVNMSKCYFRMTPNSVSMRGTSAELQSREWVTIQDLLYGMMLPSGNDAATALSQNFGAFLYYQRLGQGHLLQDLKSLDLNDNTWNIKIYSQQFVKLMNSTAKQLGMKETFYINPHGLDSSFKLEAYSTADDLAILTKALIEDQICFKIMAKNQHVGQMKTISGKEVDVRKMVWQNTNKLLGEEGFIGGKTGQTQFAGNCLASVYENKNNQRFIVIILGCSTKELRFKETRWLVEKYINKTIQI